MIRDNYLYLAYVNAFLWCAAYGAGEISETALTIGGFGPGALIFFFGVYLFILEALTSIRSIKVDNG